MHRLIAGVLALAACGRLGFDGRDGGGGGDGALGSDGDATGDAMPDCSGYLLCDDFEAPGFAAPWVVTGATLDATMAHRGRQSVHVRLATFGPNVDGNASITETQTILLFDPPELWVRAWIRLGSLPAGTNGLELISFEQTSASAGGDYLFVHSTDISLYSQFAEVSQRQAQQMPTGEWVCLVIHVVRSSAGQGSIAFSSGHLTAFALTGIATDGTPPIREIGLGLQFAGSNLDVIQPTIEAWIDDVIVHDGELSCAD